MPRYKILHRYSSSDFGPFEAGSEIELTAEEAAWLLHDSPGVLEEIDPAEQQRLKREANAERAKAYQDKTDRESERTIATARRRQSRLPKSGDSG